MHKENKILKKLSDYPQTEYIWNMHDIKLEKAWLKTWMKFHIVKRNILIISEFLFHNQKTI